MKIDDFLTHIDHKEDERYLRSVLYDVNMRLFKSSSTYRRIVQGCCNYLEKLALSQMDGYKLPHGMSGANIGIPFNIITIVKNRGLPDAKCFTMINPVITGRSQSKVQSLSNCGSIRLPEPIVVERNSNITVEWYDIDGRKCRQSFTRSDGSLTIQHEVDHNKGILITDRVPKPVEI